MFNVNDSYDKILEYMDNIEANVEEEFEYCYRTNGIVNKMREVLNSYREELVLKATIIQLCKSMSELQLKLLDVYEPKSLAFNTNPKVEILEDGTKIVTFEDGLRITV